MSHDSQAERAKPAHDRIWQQMELIYRTCGPESPEWRKLIALIASKELAERELAYQIVQCRVYFTTPN